ncbi:unnamed protein product, partial [Vitis vinifera]|uniref:Uncharacterized protein n=1 Tax=Vitis vinifera TaxID=29760 RepID=D7TIB2_VITVI
MLNGSERIVCFLRL